MGLDMYLRDATSKQEIGYWRKANQIHGWIVRHKAEGVDDCQEIPLTRKDLQELKDLCDTVLQDTSKAQDLLPPTSGFFFGSTEVDEYYFSDLQDTVKIIDNALSSRKRKFIYRASW